MRMVRSDYLPVLHYWKEEWRSASMKLGEQSVTTPGLAMMPL